MMSKYSLTPIITTNSKYSSYFDILSQPHSNVTQIRDYIEQPIKRIINTTKYEILWNNININTFLLLFNQNMVNTLNNTNFTLFNYNFKYISTKE
jgi:c-di-AMP phosphodiesterase-like protein